MNNDKLVNAKILVIDDDVNMMDVLSVVLRRYGHYVKTFTEPLSAIEELKKNKYDILLVNYLMTPVKGDKIVETVREFNKEIYIILMSIHKDLAPSIEVMQQLDIQAYYEKSNRFDNLIMLIQGGIKYIEQINKIKSMNSQLEHYLVDFAKILLQTVGAKDHYTEEHSRRVTLLADAFSKYLKLDNKQISDLQIAAAFHDIGKIGIPDNILLKTTRLTDDEYQVIKTHPVIAANIFSVSDIYKDIYSLANEENGQIPLYSNADIRVVESVVYQHESGQILEENTMDHHESLLSDGYYVIGYTLTNQYSGENVVVEGRYLDEDVMKLTRK